MNRDAKLLTIGITILLAAVTLAGGTPDPAVGCWSEFTPSSLAEASSTSSTRTALEDTICA